jgi:short-subunit dehydrogenase
VVTGAASGIGAATARALAAEGARVALLDRDTGPLIGLASRLGDAGAEVLALECDVTRPVDCDAALGEVRSAWGGIDVLVNNAGITQVGRAIETRTEVVRRVLEVNFFGALHCTRAALPSLLERRGHIVVLSSVAGFAPLATRAAYAASKHALHGFFESLRAEHRADGLGVTLVCPAFVRTAIGDHALGPEGDETGSRGGVAAEIEPERVAREILRALRRGRDLVLVPGRSRAAWWLSHLLPRRYERLMLRGLDDRPDPGQPAIAPRRE